MRNYSVLIIFLFFSISFTNAQSESAIPDYERDYLIKYEKNIRKSRIAGVYIPGSIDEVFQELDRLSSSGSIHKFKNADEEIIKSKLHFGLGRWMIYNWNFYEGSRISHLLKSMGISFPDDMAQFLIVSYHRYKNNKPLELEKRAKHYQELRLKEQLARKSEGKLIKEETRKRKN